MQIWVLMENTSNSGSIRAEHGLSLYIEACGQKILFDMGQSRDFLHNARQLGLDLSSVDLAVLSHGHYDHGGGLEAFLECNGKAPVYVSEDAFADYYNASDRYIGLDKKLADHPRIRKVKDILVPVPGLTLFSCRDRAGKLPLDSAGLQKRMGENLVPDDFVHEQYLLIEENGYRMLLSGCSHRGIVNIASWFACDVVIGGFHFMKQPPCSETVLAAAEELKAHGAVFYTCHCTGQAQYETMKQIMGDSLQYLSGGDRIRIGE